MGEYALGLEGLVGRLMEPGEGGITPMEIPELVGGGSQGDVNCYPGVPGIGCRKVAYFVSLTSKKYTKGKRGHLSFRKALETIVQHMQGHCAGETKTVILVADSWDAQALEEWQRNINRIATHASVEAHLV